MPEVDAVGVRAAPSANGSADDVLIEGVGLCAGYGAGLIIRDVDIEVRRGEVVALLGANGAGKTTTLRTLAGEFRPVSGRVRWAGSDRHVPLHRRARQGLGYVPDDAFVFRGLTTRQNLALLRHAERETALNIFPELRQLLDRRGGLLSGGEQRMLAVGRLLGPEVRLLMADELSLGLAPRTVGMLLSAIRRAVDDGGAALVVEQHVHRVLTIADRVYVMQRGRVQLVLSGAEARERLPDIQAQYLSPASEASAVPLP